MSDGLGQAPVDPAADLRADPGFRTALDNSTNYPAQAEAQRQLSERFRRAYGDGPVQDAGEPDQIHGVPGGALAVPTSPTGYTFPEAYADAGALSQALGDWGMAAGIAVGTMHTLARQIGELSQRRSLPSEQELAGRSERALATLNATAEGRQTLARARARWQALERRHPGLAEALAEQGASVDLDLIRTLGS